MGAHKPTSSLDFLDITLHVFLNQSRLQGCTIETVTLIFPHTHFSLWIFQISKSAQSKSPMKSPENTKQSTFNSTGNSHVHLKFCRIFHRSSSVHQNLPNIFPKCSQRFDLHHFFWLKHYIPFSQGFPQPKAPAPRLSVRRPDSWALSRPPRLF